MYREPAVRVNSPSLDKTHQIVWVTWGART